MKEKLLIECPCDKKKTFEKTIEFKEGNDQQGSKSMEFLCPVCEVQWIAVEFDRPIKEGVTVLRGLPKEV